VVEMIFIYNVNGENKEFSDKELMNLPEGATFVDRKDKVISEGYIPPIHDFSIELDGEDLKDELLQEPKLIMFVSYDLNLASPKGMEKLEELNQQASNKGYKVIGMTASLENDIQTAK